MISHYTVLGVSHKAEEEEIKRAYRRLVLRLHPDRSASDPTANEAFQRVQEAYRVLRDGTLRAEHDKTLAPRLDVMAYLDTFEDLLLTAQGLGMPAPILPQATTMGRLTSLEMATSQELGM